MDIRMVSCKGNCGDLLPVESIAVKEWGGYCDDCVVNQNIDIGLIRCWKYEDESKT
jgi:hypothetical protein